MQALKTEKVDVLVIGAGPAGAASAAMLCHEGLNVKVVEKAIFPRFVIGESLLPHCMDHFEEMGVLEALKKQGYQKNTKKHLPQQLQKLWMVVFPIISPLSI